MAKPKTYPPADAIALYDTLIATYPELERKGDTTPYTSVNSHMFTFLAKDGTVGIRLSKEDRAAFIAKYDTALMEQHGRTMKGFVAVPSVLLANTEELAPYLKTSHAFTQTLKPKKKKS